MKIIGTVGEHNFLISASKTEIANLVGYEDTYKLGRYQLEIGAEILVHEMFQQLYDLAHNKDALIKLADSLEGISKILRTHNPLLNDTIEGPKRIKEVVAKLDRGDSDIPF